MSFKNLNMKNHNYLILCYILTILGIIINSFLKISNSNLYFYSYVIIIFPSLINILIIHIVTLNEDSKKEYVEVKLVESVYPKLLQIKKDKCIQFYQILRKLTLILIPIIVGSYYHSIYIHTSLAYLNLIFIAFEMTLIYTTLIRGEIFQKDTIQSFISIFLIVISLKIMTEPLIIAIVDKILNYIICHLFETLTVLIAIIMLCVALSTLSFGYCSILEKSSETWKHMKKNGENYFIA